MCCFHLLLLFHVCFISLFWSILFILMWLFNCFISVIVWILRMPVSIVIASFGVDCGTWRIHFMMLFMIVCIFWLSLCVVVLLSAPYVIIGMMHVSTSFHIIAIFSPLKFLSFAMWSIVWYAASTFPSSIFMWSSRFPLLLMISPRYVYLSVSSISMSPSFSSVWTLLPIFITLLFSFPNTMRYLLEIHLWCLAFFAFLGHGCLLGLHRPCIVDILTSYEHDVLRTSPRGL